MLESHTIAGNAGRDAELIFTPAGHAICLFSVAVNSGYGEHQHTTWYTVRVWGEYGEHISQQVHKGDLIIASGHELELETFSRKDGTPGANLTLTAQQVRCLGKRQTVSEAEQGVNDDLPL